MSNTCFNLNNTIAISKNIYIFNNRDDNAITYGLFQTQGTNIYSITNVPKQYPIGFYDISAIHPAISDISQLIHYDVSYDKPIKIYVSKGSDLSFNNNDYFRFYDECYNLLNISGSFVDTTLTNSEDNFYFMRNMKYKFVSIQDFSTTYPFSLSGEGLKNLNFDNFKLKNKDEEFEIIIPKDANNEDKNIYYRDNQDDISKQLQILVDASNITYLYGDISISIDPKYPQLYSGATGETDVSKISIQSFPFNGVNTSDVSNTNLFIYDTTC